MYFNGTKCQLLVLSCFLSASLLAKDVKPMTGQGLSKPLCFIENKGQVLDGHNKSRKDVQFKLATKGLSLYVGDAKLHYQFKKVEAGAQTPEISTYCMDVALVGANPHAKVQAADEIEYYENYYLSQAADKGFTAHAFEKVVYKDVYPSIDWVLYIKGDNVEYDFVVRPGGNPDNIKLSYTGATQLSITNDGGILATTPMGNVGEKHPVAFETATGKHVDAKFALKNNMVSFVTGSYNGGLTIDPYLSWCTYAGGSNEDVINSVKSAGGNLYVTGYTASTDFPVTGGAAQASNGGGTYDAFLARYNASGSSLSFCTYFGGSGSDQGIKLSLDAAAGNVYVVGNTTSSGLATTGAYHSTNGGSTDMFLARFSNTGTKLWVTYIGGSGTESANSVTLDGSSNVYVGGSTTSTTASTIIAGGSPYQSAYGGGINDGYLAKFNSGGTMQWATYYGGSAEDEVNDVVCDGTGNLYLVGDTKSLTGIASTGAAQVSFGGGTGYDAMLACFTTGGSGARSWGTYLGSSGSDLGNGIAIDQSNNIYVTGNTSSTDTIPYGLAYQSTFGGGLQDAFLAKYTNAGARIWGTFLGGNSIDYGQGVNVDVFGNIVVGGATISSTGFSTPYAYQTSIGGGVDAFVSKFNTWGQNIYTTYFGASGTDYAYGITTDAGSSVTIAGLTNSTSGLSTAGTIQSSIGGGSGTYHDGFMANFLRDTLVAFRQRFTDTLVCAGGTLTVHDTTNFNFASGNKFYVMLSDATGSFATPDTIGSTSAVSTGSINCTIPASATPGLGYRIRLVASNPFYVSPDNIYDIRVVNSLPAQTLTGSTPVCVGQPIHLFDSAPYLVTSYSWSGPGGSGFTSALQNPSIAVSTSADSGVYTLVTTHNGCSPVTNTFNVYVSTYFPPAPWDSAVASICTGSPVQLFSDSHSAIGGYTYSWTGTGLTSGFTSTLQNPTVSHIPGPGVIKYYVRDSVNGCPSPLDSVVITTLPNDTPKITISVSPNDTVCAGTLVHFTSSTSFAGYSPTFQWMSGPTTLISGAVLDYYSTATFPGGTRIRCILTSSVACPDKPSDTSNYINMVLLNTTPVVTIYALSDTFISSGGSVSFNSTVGGSSILSGTWYVNNVAQHDSLGTLSLTNIHSNDTVRYEVSSNASCASIGVSNTIVVHVNVGVESANLNGAAVEITPNPNSGSFSIKGAFGTDDDKAGSYEITNAIGQVVSRGQLSIHNGQITTSLSLTGYTPGLYLIRLSKDNENKTLRFIMQ